MWMAQHNLLYGVARTFELLLESGIKLSSRGRGHHIALRLCIQFSLECGGEKVKGNALT